MKANINSDFMRYLKVFFNGKENTSDCVEASEEDGYVLVAYQNVEGRFIPEQFAEKGALIANEIQVIRLNGNVKMEVGSVPELSNEEVCKRINDSFVPLVVTVKE